jgi:hypothetical protein
MPLELAHHVLVAIKMVFAVFSFASEAVFSRQIWQTGQWLADCLGASECGADPR